MTTTQQPVRSQRVAQATGLTLLDRGVRVIKQAGAKTEAAYERDGFLSYHAETHAAGAGLGLGFTIAASGEYRYLGVLLEAVIFGNRGERVFGPDLLEDVKTELHYFLGGLLAGAAFGALANTATQAVDAGVTVGA